MRRLLFPLLWSISFACAPAAKRTLITPVAIADSQVTERTWLMSARDNALLRRYWTDGPHGAFDPPRHDLACVWGWITGDTVVVDSIVVQPRCSVLALGGLGTVGEQDQLSEKGKVIGYYCGVLKARPTFRVAGLVVGIKDAPNGRAPNIWACVQ